MTVLIYETSTIGVSPKIVDEKQKYNLQVYHQIHPIDISPNPTFQIFTTSAVSGTIQTTLDGENFIDIIDFAATTQDSESVIYDGIMTDFRVVVKAISGTLKIVVGV
jgi:hypothetical protein